MSLMVLWALGEVAVSHLSSSRGCRRKSASGTWTGTSGGSRRLVRTCCMSGSGSETCETCAGPWTTATSAWPGSSEFWGAGGRAV